MGVKTFFWQERENRVSRISRLVQPRRAPGLRIGNAGDLYNRDLISFLYQEAAVNSKIEGERLLLVGSVAHRAGTTDIVCGIGTKGIAVKTAAESELKILGVRGPLTRAAFQDAGHDISSIRFQLDPGLLAAEVYREEAAVKPRTGHVVFVPHYRDLPKYQNTRDVEIVSVDSQPRDFIRKLASAEYIYSSSLHGIVFAHALGRPCTLVAPENSEPEIKYRDYFASLSLPWNAPPNYGDATRLPLNDTLNYVPNTISAFDFPSLDFLKEHGVVTSEASQ